MTTRFYIERRRDKAGNLQVKKRPVFMSVSFQGNRIMIGTGVNIDLHGWDPDLQMVKIGYPGSESLNIWLKTLRNTAEKVWASLQGSNEAVSQEDFRNLFLNLKPKFSSGFFDVFYLFMEEGGKRWSVSTHKKVRTIYKHLREFEGYSGFRIAFTNLDEVFLDKFISFYSDRGYSPATTLKAVNNIVWFMNWATDQGYNISRDYRKFYKSLPSERIKPGDPVFLKWDELMEIRNFPTENRRMERARDLFCFSCFTGVRFSELQRLRKEDVGLDEIVIRKKGDNFRKLPSNKYSRGIYQAYENKYYRDNAAFPVMSIVTLNKYLRIIGKEAGLTRGIFSAADKVLSVPLYERLTAGIAVNTFIANALELDIPVEVISNFTGIRQDRRISRIKAELVKEEIKKFDRA